MKIDTVSDVFLFLPRLAQKAACEVRDSRISALFLEAMAFLGRMAANLSRKVSVFIYGEFPGTKTAAAAKKVEKAANSVFNEETLIKNFWEAYFSKDLHTFLEMVMANTPKDNVENIPEILIDHYEGFLQQKEEVLDSSCKKILIDSVAAQIGTVKSLKSFSELKMASGETLYVYPTVGDGSCAFHALLGSNEEMVYRCNAKEARKAFVEWIREENKKGAPPKIVEQILDSYFLEFEYAPSAFTEKVRNIHADYFAGYKDLSNDQQEEKKRLFRKNKVVFNAYLDTLLKVGEYLLQSELELAAICFNKKVILCQPGWGNDSRIAQEVLNPTGEGQVVIYYNGYNHYERAKII